MEGPRREDHPEMGSETARNAAGAAGGVFVSDRERKAERILLDVVLLVACLRAT